MYSYALLEPGCYYLIQEKEEDPVTLIKITVETDQCLYVTRFAESPVLEWKKKQMRYSISLNCWQMKK